MRSVRFAKRARVDLATILDASAERWGDPGRERYEALFEEALRRLAEDPFTAGSRDRSDVMWKGRSFHLRHVRGGTDVGAPVHAIYYRATKTTLDVVAVLHERMDPAIHLPPPKKSPRRRKS